jgi:hypothetical protein
MGSSHSFCGEKLALPIESDQLNTIISKMKNQPSQDLRDFWSRFGPCQIKSPFPMKIFEPGQERMITQVGFRNFEGISDSIGTQLIKIGTWNDKNEEEADIYEISNGPHPGHLISFPSFARFAFVSKKTIKAFVEEFRRAEEEGELKEGFPFFWSFFDTQLISVDDK